MQHTRTLILNLPGEMLHDDFPLEELRKIESAVQADIREILDSNLEDEE